MPMFAATSWSIGVGGFGHLTAALIAFMGLAEPAIERRWYRIVG
jgi:hypothetical protein